MPDTWVALNDAADMYATAMTRRDEDEACLNEEETKRAHEQHKNDFMRKLQPSTSLDAKKPAGASVFISSKQPATAEPATAEPATAESKERLGDAQAHPFADRFPGVMDAMQQKTVELCVRACYKFVEGGDPAHLTEESDEELKRRYNANYNEMKVCLADTLGSIPKAIEDAYDTDRLRSFLEAAALGKKRKLREWRISDCDFWDDE